MKCNLFVLLKIINKSKDIYFKTNIFLIKDISFEILQKKSKFEIIISSHYCNK